MTACQCIICNYGTSSPNPQELGAVRGNTARFSKNIFHLWQCPKCLTIYSLDPVDFSDIYVDYPLNRRQLDIYARGTLGNLLRRLKHAGMDKSCSILDYGCGNGVFVEFLKQKGYAAAVGYDPYVSEFSRMRDNGQFDWIIANDVAEHVPDPRALVRQCVNLLRPGGFLYMGTADSEGVRMNDLEPHVMRLHQPFHRIIFTQKTLLSLGREVGLELINTYRRSYMDTLVPFANYRFLDEFSKALGHDMDRMLDPAAGKIMLHRPMLWFHAFFGYYFPSADEPAAVFRKPG